MGNYISNNTVYLSAKRAFMKYNIESRVLKEFEKQAKKPLPAPKHDAGIMDYHKSLKANTEYLEKSTIVDKSLDVRLKDVYVTSKGLTENIKTNKPLPVERTSEIFTLGYKESDRVPPGRVSLLQAINFIGKHQTNPKEWTPEKIAQENKIKVDVADDIVKYFRIFDVHLSKKLDKKELKKIKSDMKLLGTNESKLISDK